MSNGLMFVYTLYYEISDDFKISTNLDRSPKFQFRFHCEEILLIKFFHFGIWFSNTFLAGKEISNNDQASHMRFY